jgi:hypothetical protein
MKTLHLFILLLTLSCASSYQTAVNQNQGTSALEITFVNSGVVELYIDGNKVHTPNQKYIKSLQVNGIEEGKKEIFFIIENGSFGSFSRRDSVEFFPGKTKTILVDNQKHEVDKFLNLLLTCTAGVLVGILLNDSY